MNAKLADTRIGRVLESTKRVVDLRPVSKKGSINLYDAFVELTGRDPLTDDGCKWEYRLFLETVRATTDPTPERQDWVMRATRKWRAGIGKAVAIALSSLENAPLPGTIGLSRSWKLASADDIRGALAFVDARFDKLTDKQIAEGQKRKSPTVALAIWALATGALEAKRPAGKPESAAIKSLSDNFRKARDRVRNRVFSKNDKSDG